MEMGNLMFDTIIARSTGKNPSVLITTRSYLITISRTKNTSLPKMETTTLPLKYLRIYGLMGTRSLAARHLKAQRMSQGTVLKK